jgi:hypothetical protein
MLACRHFSKGHLSLYFVGNISIITVLKMMHFIICDLKIIIGKMTQLRQGYDRKTLNETLKI